MKRLLRWGLALALTGGVLAAAWLAARWSTLGDERGPPPGGRLTLAGLHGPLQIVRDPFGVPHIDAAHELDAYLGLGFVHAQDRLWQMELQRRSASGTLSELFGRRTLGVDRLARVLAFDRDAVAEHPELPRSARRVLAAYCRGVNAWLDAVEAGHAPMPVEMRWLEIRPAPWTPEDVLAVLRWQAWSTSRSLGATLLLDRLVRELGGVSAKDFFPARPRDGSLSLLGSLLDVGRTADRLAQLGGPAGPVGSSGFVVGAEQSRSGGPLLASDPHVPFSLPAVFYLAHLRAQRIEIGGLTRPGLPLFLAGTNGNIAWGQVALHASVSDLFDETLHPGDPLRYERGGRWRQVAVARETIGVRGSAPVELEIRRTGNGPLLGSVLPKDERAAVLSLRWTGAGASGGFGSLLAVQHARDWEGFREALRGLVVPPATFLYASVDGEIGTQVAGRLPVRAIETGLLPVTGGSQYYDWRGYLEFEELPAQHGTDLSWLVASTHPTHPDLAQRVTWLWSSPGGSARLRQALASRRRWSFDEVVDLQRERRSARGPEAVRFLLGKVEPASRSALRVHDELLAWAGDVGTDSRGAALYHVFRQRLAHRILRRHAASGFVDQIADVRDPLPGVVLARFLDRAGGSHSEAIVEQALDDTWSYMRTRVSANPAKWTWGRTQQLRPRHAFERHGSWLLRAIGRRLGRGPFGAPGDSDSVWAMYSGELPTEDVGVGPAARYAVDLSDWRHAQVGLAGGQSGYAGEAHYDDALQDWLQARPRPLWMHWNDVTYHGIGTWELTPPDR